MRSRHEPIRVGDVLDHQGVRVRVNDFSVDDRGVTILNNVTLLEVLLNEWTLEHNPHLIAILGDIVDEGRLGES
jgi:hypothetical protein